MLAYGRLAIVALIGSCFRKVCTCAAWGYWALAACVLLDGTDATPLNLVVVLSFGLETNNLGHSAFFKKSLVLLFRPTSTIVRNTAAPHFTWPLSKETKSVQKAWFDMERTPKPKPR